MIELKRSQVTYYSARVRRKRLIKNYRLLDDAMDTSCLVLASWKMILYVVPVKLISAIKNKSVLLFFLYKSFIGDLYAKCDYNSMDSSHHHHYSHSMILFAKAPFSTSSSSNAI